MTVPSRRVRQPRRSYVLAPKPPAARKATQRQRAQRAAELVGLTSITDLVNLVLEDAEFAAAVRDAVAAKTGIV